MLAPWTRSPAADMVRIWSNAIRRSSSVPVRPVWQQRLPCRNADSRPSSSKRATEWARAGARATPSCASTPGGRCRSSRVVVCRGATGAIQPGTTWSRTWSRLREVTSSPCGSEPTSSASIATATSGESSCRLARCSAGISSSQPAGTRFPTCRHGRASASTRRSSCTHRSSQTRPRMRGETSWWWARATRASTLRVTWSGPGRGSRCRCGHHRTLRHEISREFPGSRCSSTSPIICPRSWPMRYFACRNG